MGSDHSVCKKYFKQTRIRSDPPTVRVAPHVDACVSAERLRHDAFARQFGDLTAAEAKSLLAQLSALAELRRMRVGRTLASSDDVLTTCRSHFRVRCKRRWHIHMRRQQRACLRMQPFSAKCRLATPTQPFDLRPFGQPTESLRAKWASQILTGL